LHITFNAVFQAIQTTYASPIIPLIPSELPLITF